MGNDLKVNLRPILSNSISQSEEMGDRFLSFDYCFNHFHPTNLNNVEQDIEKACLMIGFYLASWGMLRGSSFLLWKNAKHYEKLVNYILVTRNDFVFDVDEYSDYNIERLTEDLYINLREAIGANDKTHLTLVTKIMLGVYGVAPAFDQNFIKGFSNLFDKRCGFTKFNSKSLKCIKEFYDANFEEINRISSTTFTKEFGSGEVSNVNYPKIKIIDMYGFEFGRPKRKS